MPTNLPAFDAHSGKKSYRLVLPTSEVVCPCKEQLSIVTKQAYHKNRITQNYTESNQKSFISRREFHA